MIFHTELAITCITSIVLHPIYMNLILARMAANQVVGRDYETHDGSISPTMAYFVTMHSRLMDISSSANRRKLGLGLFERLHFPLYERIQGTG